MSNFYSSAKHNGHPLSEKATEVVALSGVHFGTGIANTAIVYDIYDYSKRMLYIDITGSFTGGMSSPVTVAVASKPTNHPVWTTLHSYSLTNTAYVFSLNPTGISLSAQWVPLENIRMTVTNPNTGTGAGVTQVTAIVNLTLSLAQ